MKRAIKSFFSEIHLKNIMALTIAGTINAFGITMFLMPLDLLDSGISGTSMFLAQFTEPYVPFSIFLILLNVPLFLYGTKKQGLAFTFYSVYTVAVYSGMSAVFTNLLPIDISTISPFARDDILLCAIFGGLISGIGSGLAIRFGGALDGIEVMAVIFAKKLNITVGTFVMIYNVILYIACGLVHFDWILPLYSIIAYAVALKAVDFIVEGLERSKAVMIITEKPDEVSDALIKTFETGTTKISAKGGYSNLDKTMIYFVVNRFQISRMQSIVHTIDPKAYMTITEVADVFTSIQNA